MLPGQNFAGSSHFNIPGFGIHLRWLETAWLVISLARVSSFPSGSRMVNLGDLLDISVFLE
jgi:hypothetical protein